MAETAGPLIMELDGRRRANFAKLGRKEDRRYLVTQHPDGTLVLEPAVVMSKLEAAFLASPAWPKVKAALDDPSKMVRRTRRRA